MEQLAGIMLLVLAGWWVFRQGKRLGSRQGYGSARSRYRQRRKSRS